MNLKNIFLLLILGGMIFSCGSSSKTIGTQAERQQLEELVSQRNFQILSDRAMPLATASLNSISNAGLLPPGSSASQISLIGNSNYLRVMGDSVSVYLPYFGERQMGGGYNNNGPGIKLEGMPQSMEIIKDDEKQSYNIKFKMKDASEMFSVHVTLFPNLNSMINVNSSQRFPIRYSGKVSAISEE